MSETNDRREVIARRLRLARELAGLSQAQAAQVIGVHRPALTEIEAARRKVAAEELIQLADAYGVSIEWLTGRTAEHADARDDELRLAARELAKLDAADLDRLLRLLSAFRGDTSARDTS